MRTGAGGQRAGRAMGRAHVGRAVHRARTWARDHPGMVVMLALPIAVFTLPDLFGRAFLDGDNFTQNFPFRVLVGRDIGHGHLPLLNPYIFGGTPLLGGFNAGVAYPATWLMAILPKFFGWSLNVVAAYDVGVAGMYLFLRRQRVDSTAAAYGAAAFAFGGYLAGQLIHIDLIEGASWLPWTLLAVLALTEVPLDHLGHGVPPRPRRPLRWSLLLAVALGLSILSGGAEAFIDNALLVGIYSVWQLCSLWRHDRVRWHDWARSFGWICVGSVGGVAVGAAQWVSGLTFQSQSQRSLATYQYFTSGSLDYHLLPLLVSPFVMGTNQGFAGYVGQYNFPEVTSYMGILALIAVCSLWSRRWRRRPEAANWWVWYLVVVVGLLSALGRQTPFGHLLFLVPGINRQRLLNRNLLLVDFAFSVLFAWWAHLMLTGRNPGSTGESGPIRDRWRTGQRGEVLLTCAPAALIVALCGFLWVDSGLLLRLLAARGRPSLSSRLLVDGVVTLGAALAVFATWVTLAEGRFPVVKLRRLLSTILVLDLALFTVFTLQFPIDQALAGAAGSTASRFAALVGNGRFLIYDPNRFQANQLNELGQPDLNVLDSLSSGQGYAALVDGRFYRATGAHVEENLDPASLRGPGWDTLNVRILLSLPSYFVTPVNPVPGADARGGGSPPPAVPFPNPVGADVPGAYLGAPLDTDRPVGLRASEAHTWYFGGVLATDELTVPVLSGPVTALQVGLVSADGSTRWLPEAPTVAPGGTGGHTVRIALSGPTPAGGIVVRSTSGPPVSLGVPTVRTAEAGEVALDGRMQYGIDASHWRFTGTFAGFGVFSDKDARGWAWASSSGGGPPPPGTTVVAGAPSVDGQQRVTVHATGKVEVQRSMTWAEGWQVTVERADGGPVPGAEVGRSGLVQQVALPGPGDYVVTFRYAEPWALLGIGISAAAVVALVAAAGWELASYSRRRRRGSAPGPTGGRVSPD